MGGRHRKTTQTLRNLAAVSASGAFAVVPLAGVAHADPAAPDGPPGGWGPIAQCESGGDPAAQNPHSTASGLFQFLDSTWAALGGTQYGPRAKDATPQQQTEIADRAYANSGLSPWEASRSCWSGRIHNAPTPAPTPHVAPTPPAPVGGDYVIGGGETLGSIAAEHHLTWQQLWEANRAVVANPSLIYVGQTLTIPSPT